MGKLLGLPLDASAHGAEVDHLIVLVHYLMFALLVGWGIFFVFTLYRFRARRQPIADYVGVRSHTSSYLEAGVAIAEVILLVGFSIPAWSRWIDLPGPEAGALEVRVVAEQFAWNVHYPGPDGKFGKSDARRMGSENPLGLDRQGDPAAADDVTTINQLHLPVDRPVIVRLSTKDVIHSFGLPVMRVKQDAIPGQEIPVWFTPKRTNQGERWEIACAQLCGLGHFRMRGFLTVHEPAEFEAWLAAEAPTPPAAAPVPEVAQPTTS